MKNSHVIERRSSHTITLLLAVIALIICALAPASASASHYYIEDTELFSAELMQRFQTLNISTTEELLLKVTEPQGREELAQALNISPEEMTGIARTVELLQIDGIGPKASRLLQLAGVTSVSDLASRSAPSLLIKLIEANNIHQVTGISPDLEVVADWVEKAGRAEHHVH